MKRIFGILLLFFCLSLLVGCWGKPAELTELATLTIKCELFQDLNIVSGEWRLVEFQSMTEKTGQVVIGEVGVAVVEDLQPGQWQVYVNLYNVDGTIVESGAAMVDVTVEPTIELELEMVRYDELSSVSGYAKYLDGNIHDGIIVEVQIPIEGQMQCYQTETDERGYFCLRALPVNQETKMSEYLFTAYSITDSRYCSDSRIIEVTGGEETRLTSDLLLRYAGIELMLFLDVPPWWTESLDEMLQQVNVPFQVYNSVEMGSVSLANDQVVWVVNDQDWNFYNNYFQNQSKFNEFVANGGTLIFGAAQGYNFGSLMDVGGTLPADVTTELSSASTNFNLLPTHPLMYGIPEILTGDNASNNWFDNLPTERLIILEDDQHNPTLVEYRYNLGRVIAVGQPLEYSWAEGEDAKLILLNLVKYTFSMLPLGDE